MNYETLSEALVKRMEEDRKNGNLPALAFRDEDAVRRYDRSNDRASFWRGPFVRDIDKIMHCPFYCRYADKTQVFSVYKNIDISRRVLHVQLVSRIARTIGSALGLNTDLIEAIALGHDIGHSPFGHIGEKLIDETIEEKSGMHFSHNIQSVRILDKIFPYNITLQTLSGIASHDGESEKMINTPTGKLSYEDFDSIINECEKDRSALERMVPATLEACVVKISDIIAYLGKDRQDAEKLGHEINYESGAIGTINAEIINNLIVNIIENSYKKPYIAMDEEHFLALKKAKEENYRFIYNNTTDELDAENTLKPMINNLYSKLYSDLTESVQSSPIFTHHIKLIEDAHYPREKPYAEEPPHRIVTDFIASMTDTYFSEIYAYLFPKSSLKINYRNYF